MSKAKSNEVIKFKKTLRYAVAYGASTYYLRKLSAPKHLPARHKALYIKQAKCLMRG